MIPRTYPTRYNTFNGSTQVIVKFISDTTNLVAWIDYIPVNYGSQVTDVPNSYDGYMSVYEITDTSSKQAWKDYVPVYLDSTRTVPWSTNANGYIPIGYGTQDNDGLGGYGFYLGPSLVLDFVYNSGADTYSDSSLTLDFIGKEYLITQSSELSDGVGKYWVQN